MTLLAATGLGALAAGCSPPQNPPNSGVVPAAPSVPVAVPAAPPVPVAVPAAPSVPVAVAPPAKRDDKVREISFDDVKLPLAKGDPYTPEILPPAVKALEQQRVRIRGYILPSFQQRGITQFVLVRDNMECCFGPGALLHDCVVVRMRPGKSADFSIRPVAVSGTFRIEELKGPDGRHLAIYAIDGDEVK